MKKTLLFVAALAISVCASAQVETVIFDGLTTYNETTEKWAAVDYTADFAVGSFSFTAASDRKFAVDGNTAYFYEGAVDDNGKLIDENATAETSDKYVTRLKSGGSTNSKGRSISFPAERAGVLKIAARPATADATGRHLVVGGTQVEILDDAVYKGIVNDDATVTKIYPYQSVNIAAAGTVTITFDASINVYAFIWTPEGSSSIDVADADKGAVVASVSYDALGRKVSDDAKGLVIKKVTYENGATETIKTIVK